LLSEKLGEQDAKAIGTPEMSGALLLFRTNDQIQSPVIPILFLEM
jgi:hypothetical protein